MRFPCTLGDFVSEPSFNPLLPLWFTVLSKPRREMEAIEQLERQGYKTFLPKVRSQRRLRGRWQTTVEPMFPRYLFLQATLGLDNLYPVRSTRGVVGLVRFGGEVKPVPDAVMVELQQLCTDDNDVLELPNSLIPGCKVRVLEGPFAGYEADLLSLDGDRRALVLLKLLGRANTIVFPVDMLAPTD